MNFKTGILDKVILFVVLVTFSGLSCCADFQPGKGIFHPKSFVLENGLKVVVLENHRSPVVRHQIWYNCGFIDDPQGKSGLAHYLEHMMFSPEIMSLVAHLGGEQNAFTNTEYTSYYQTVPKVALQKVMAMEAGRMARLAMDPKKIKTEKQVIIEERRMRVDNSPAGILSEAMLRNFFWNHPYGRPGIGWENEMEGLSQSDIEQFHKKWYVPNNAVLFLAGDITVKEAQELAKQYYASVPSCPIAKGRSYLQEPKHRGVSQVVELKSDQVEYPLLHIMYRAPSNHGKYKSSVAPLEVAATLLSNGPSSVFYQKLVLGQKLATSIDVSYDSITKGPTFITISAQPTPETSLEKLESAIHKCLQDVIKTGVDRKLAEKTKQRMVAGIQYAKDYSFGGIDHLGQVLMANLNMEYIETWPDRIMSVKPEEVDQALKLVFANSEKLVGRLVPANSNKGKI